MFTGDTVGIAWVLHYATGLPLGALFSVIIIPLYALAWRRMGKRFTIETVAVVSLLSVLSEQLPSWVGVDPVEPWFAALAGELLLGVRGSSSCSGTAPVWVG